jgi:hypothetical protein
LPVFTEGRRRGVLRSPYPARYNRTRDETDALHAPAAEMHEMAKELERLSQGTRLVYAGPRVNVEARAALDLRAG